MTDIPDLPNDPDAPLPDLVDALAGHDDAGHDALHAELTALADPQE